MADRLRVAVAGCGGHMYEFLHGALRWAPPTEVVAAADPDADRLERFTRFYRVGQAYADHRTMLDETKPDAVIVATDMQGHFDVAKDALERGIHVFVEKTPCVDVRQADELIALQKQSGKILMVGFNRRYATSFVMAKEISSREEFGGIQMYQSQFHSSPYRSEAHFKLNHLIHHLDLARFLLGEITLTHAERVSINDRMTGFAVSFRSASGAIGTIQAGSLLNEVYPMERLELLGQQRNIVVDSVKDLTYNRPHAMRKDTFTPFTLAEGSDALVWNPSHGFYPRYSHHGYEPEMHAFIAAVTNGTVPQPDIADARKTMQLLDDLERLI